MCNRWPIWLILAAVVPAGCAPTGSDGGGSADERPARGFPTAGADQGKQDVFGRSLVGAPNPYIPNSDLLADSSAADAELQTNMRRRRQVAWQSIHKLLEPVPLLGLQAKAGGRPACADGVQTAAIDGCAGQREAGSCVEFGAGIANEAGFEQLQDGAGLRSDRAEAIIDYRNGSDGVAGTGDDRRFKSRRELRSVDGIGPVSVQHLRDYAAEQGKRGGAVDLCEWDADASTCRATCDRLTLADGRDVPKIPRWQTWYGVEDVNRIFKNAYSRLTTDQQRARAPLSDRQIGRAFKANNSAVERSSRWPLGRYTDAVDQLFGCDLDRREDESRANWQRRCAVARQSKFSGASAAGDGIARMMYSPAMVLHLMRNYPQVLACRDDKLTETWCKPGQPCVDPPDNFSTCFNREFPANAGNPWQDLAADGPGGDQAGGLAGLAAAGGTVLIKANWSRVGFGFELPAYDTDADALARRIGVGQPALWSDSGDRTYEAAQGSDDPGFPTPQDIYTIKTSSGAVYRLTGLHVMTKELRHWQWITLWWSDKPDLDFGADRPADFDGLPSVWSHYKMCVVVDYIESDPDVLDRFDDLPSLRDALAATNPTLGAPTWCSNPYIEHDRGNARTNCIGCHQHAGTRFAELPADDPPKFDVDDIIAHESANLNAANRFPANGRLRRRNRFASDYSWAFSRLDDLTELVRTEVEYQGAQDDQWTRMNAILNGDGSLSRGQQVFRNATADQTCTDCHGADGQGGFGPALAGRFAQKTDWQLLHTILEGRSPMPAWGERLTNQELTDLFAFLRANFSSH